MVIATAALEDHQESEVKRGPRPGSPQAKRGGGALVDRIRRMGGDEAVKAYFSRIGKLGAAAIKGSIDYAAIGRKGGKATKDAHGNDFYVAIGRKGGKARKGRKMN